MSVVFETNVFCVVFWLKLYKIYKISPEHNKQLTILYQGEIYNMIIYFEDSFLPLLKVDMI